MPTLTATPDPTAVRFGEDSFCVDLDDGRTLCVPLAWFPRLARATPDQRATVELRRGTLRWEALDEDIPVAGLLAGKGEWMRARKVRL